MKQKKIKVNSSEGNRGPSNRSYNKTTAKSPSDTDTKNKTTGQNPEKWEYPEESANVNTTLIYKDSHGYKQEDWDSDFMEDDKHETEENEYIETDDDQF